MNSEEITALVHQKAQETEGATYRVTTRGTPSIIFKSASIVYVANAGKWKVFTPWPAPAEAQKKYYFTSWEKLIHFFNTGEVEK